MNANHPSWSESGLSTIVPNQIKAGDSQSTFCVAIAEARDILESGLLVGFANELKHCDVFWQDNSVALAFRQITFRVATAECLNAAHRLWPDFMPFPLFIGVGHTVTGAENIGYSYETARFLLNYRFIYYEDKIINLDSLETRPQAHQITADNCIAMLIQNNRVGLRRACRDWLQRYRSEPASEGDIKMEISQFFMHLVWGLERKMQYRLVERDVNRWTERFKLARSLNQLFDALLANFYELTEVFIKRESQSPAEQILDAVHDHFAEDITLESLAEQLNYNSAYLGRLVKQELGISFHRLRDQVRIDEAKRLLTETALPVSEISLLVGFKDKDYFSSKFKQIVGSTPRDFRQS